MKTDCEVVRDLLPLYIDGVCSLESMRMVEEHLKGCGECRMLYERMSSKEGGQAPAPDASAVIKKTAREMTVRAMLSAAGVAAIVVYWALYFVLGFLSDGGDYRFFSYRFCAVIRGGVSVDLVIAATLVWFALRLWRAIKRKSWRRNLAMLCVLAVIFSAEAAYYVGAYRQGFGVTDFLAEVLEKPDEYHVVVWYGDDEGGMEVTLEGAPNVINLLEVGETYALSYSKTDQSSAQGRIKYVYGRSEALG